LDKEKIAVLVNIRDRPTELALLLESLRTQTDKNFDVFILDDFSGTPLEQYYFVQYIIMRMKLEGNKIFYKKTPFNFGVSRARQSIVDWAMSDGYDLFCRVDDDVILEPDYLERLRRVLNEGYDIASGVTVSFGPQLKRKPNMKIVNRVILDDQGNFIMNGDDCGMSYTESKILPAHHFRSCALMKRSVHEKIKYYPTRFTKHGFREEEIFSFKALMNGFKIGVDTSAVNFHLMTPSGGERFPEQNEMVRFNQTILEEFTKEHKEELNKIFTREDYPSQLGLKKESNLLMK